MKKENCKKCGANLQSYFLKNGECNACRNPESVVTAATEYTSSIVSKFGDSENVRRDAAMIHEILSRQGAAILVDVLADHIASNINRWKLSHTESQRVVDSLLSDIFNALNERT